MAGSAERGAPGPDRAAGPGRGLWVVVGLAAALRLWALTLPIGQIDRLFLPDDTYYVLAIARNIVAHGAISADGTIATSGFQPLIALFYLPVVGAVADPDLALRIAVAISAGFGVLAVWLTGRLSWTLSGNRAVALGAAAFLGFAPVVLKNDMNGLETSLAAAVALGLALAVAGVRREGTRSRVVLVGVLAGLALWARVDLVLLILPLAALGLLRAGPKAVGLAAAVALAVAAPWLAWCVHISGLPVPESGAAVRLMARGWIENYGYLVPAELALRMLAGLVADDSHGVLMTVSSAIVLVVIWSLRPPARQGEGLRVALAVAVLAIFCFYAFYLPANWFFLRYFNLTFILLVLLFGDAVAGLARVSRPAALVAGALAAAALGVNAVQFRHLPAPDAQRLLYRPLDGITGYREAAIDIHRALPGPTTLAAMQSGALTWYAPPDHRVVNLDGVVNRFALKAARADGLCGYLRREGVGYFAGWNSGLAALVAQAGVPEADLGLRKVHDAPRQGSLGFSVYAVSPTC